VIRILLQNTILTCTFIFFEIFRLLTAQQGFGDSKWVVKTLNSFPGLSANSQPGNQ
jgi:hypothetical protein